MRVRPNVGVPLLPNMPNHHSKYHTLNNIEAPQHKEHLFRHRFNSINSSRNKLKKAKNLQQDSAKEQETKLCQAFSNPLLHRPYSTETWIFFWRRFVLVGRQSGQTLHKQTLTLGGILRFHRSFQRRKRTWDSTLPAKEFWDSMAKEDSRARELANL